MKIRTALLSLALIAALFWLCLPRIKDDGSSVTIPGRQGSVRALALAPDGAILASSAAQSETVSVWDALNGFEIRSMTTSGIASSLAFSQSGAVLTAIDPSSTNAIESWDSAGRLLERIQSPVPRPSELAYSPVARTLVVVQSDLRHRNAELFVIGTAANTLRHRFHIPGCVGPEPIFSPTGRFLTIGIDDLDAPPNGPAPTAIRTWDVNTGTELPSFDMPRNPEHLQFSPDEQTLAAWWNNEAMTVEIWDVKPGKFRQSLSVRIKASLSDVKFSPDGRFLAWSAGDETPTMLPGYSRHYGEVRIWELASGRNTLTLELDGPVTCLAFSAGGSRLAAGSQDGSIRIWDLAPSGGLAPGRGRHRRK